MNATLKTSIFQLQITLAVAFLLTATATAPAAQAVWTAVVGTSADTNWSDLNNWQGGVNPSGNNCVFNDATGVGNNTIINNVVDTSENPASLTYTNIGTVQNTLILPGVTLTIGTGGLTMGNTTQLGTDPATAITTTISGAGATLVASNDTVNIGYSAQTTTGGSLAVMNMSGLANFIGTNMNHIYVGEGSTRISGTLYLAATNYIYFTGASSSSSPNLDIGDNSGNNGPGAYLYLGQTNVISVNDIGIGLKKQDSGNGGEMFFNTSFNNPVAYFYGTNGPTSQVSTWAMGDGQATGGTTTCQGTADFTSGTVYANVNNMWLGRSSSAESGGSPVSNGTLTFAAGRINVINMTNGWITSAKEASTTATGTVNVNGTAVLSVAGNMVLAATNTGLAYGTDTVEAQGELFIDAGTVLVNKITTGGMGNSGNGYGGYIQMTGGLLVVTNTIGSTAYPINYLALGSSATLQLSAPATTAGPATAQVQYLATIDSSTTLINVSTLPVVSAYPSTFPLITYQSQPYGDLTFSLGTLPSTYMGYVSNDNTSTVWLVITNGPALPKLCEWGGGVNDDWDTTSLNWTNNGVAVTYNENDSVLFNDLAQTPTVNLTVPHTPATWTVTNSILNYTFTGSGVEGDSVLVKSGTASLTLSESGDSFSGGISILGGTVVLDQSSSGISGGLSIASGATAQIGNNDANGALPAGTVADSGTLVYDQTVSTLLSTAISGTGGLTQEGTSILALSAANTYTGNTLVSAGTLAVTNGGSISDSAAVTVNNATLDLSAQTSVTLNNLNLANAALNASVAYSRTPVSVANLSLGGTANTINIESLPAVATYPATITLIQSASAVSGSDITLGSLPAASPSYAGTVSVSGNQVVLNLASGPVGVRPYVTWSGADVPNLHTNWSDNDNWQTPGAPGAADNVVFTETAAQTASALSTPGGGSSDLNFADINNLVDANFTISSLSYTNVGGTYQNTYVAAGHTLTLSNTNTSTSADIFAVGSGSTDFGDAASIYVTISGSQGVLNVNNTNNNFYVGMVSAAGAGSQATLDLSALSTLKATVYSFEVGALPQDTLDLTGNAYLAQTNVITAVGGTNNESGQNETMSFMVGENGKGASGECFLYLGQQNTINANYMGVSLAKEPAELTFNPIWSNPSVTIHGADGVSPVAVWGIGDALAQSGGSTSPTGIADFTGGTVNALVNTMYIGRSPNAAGPHPSTGTLTFDAGTFAATTIYDGYQAYDTSDNGVGTINVSGTGLLQINTLNLAWTTGGETSPTTGALDITNGTAQIGTVVCDSHAAGQSTINLVNGTLVLTHTAGATGAPLTALNLTGGTLQLDVNGTANITNIVATAVTTSGTTALTIGSLTGVTTGVTYPLISYTSTDPFGSLSLSLPAGYQGTLVDNPGVVGLLLSVAPPLSGPRFSSISVSGSTLSIAGTNGVADGSFILLETTNLAPPIHWSPALTNSYDAHGAFNVSTNILTPTASDMFFTVTNVP